MRRRLVIDMDDGGILSEDILGEMFAVLIKYTDCNADFSVRQEMIPENNTGELQIPDCVRGGAGDGKTND